VLRVLAGITILLIFINRDSAGHAIVRSYKLNFLGTSLAKPHFFFYFQ